MGQIICNLGDVLQNELQVCLPIFLDRLRNEITRLTTVKALIKVAGSPLKINLSSILVNKINYKFANEYMNIMIYIYKIINIYLNENVYF